MLSHFIGPSKVYTALEAYLKETGHHNMEDIACLEIYDFNVKNETIFMQVYGENVESFRLTSIEKPKYKNEWWSIKIDKMIIIDEVI